MEQHDYEDHECTHVNTERYSISHISSLDPFRCGLIIETGVYCILEMTHTWSIH